MSESCSTSEGSRDKPKLAKRNKTHLEASFGKADPMKQIVQSYIANLKLGITLILCFLGELFPKGECTLLLGSGICYLSIIFQGINGRPIQGLDKFNHFDQV